MDDKPAVEACATALPLGDLIRIPTIVRGEVYFGLLQMMSGRRRLAMIAKANDLFSEVPTVELPPDAWFTYGQVKRRTRSIGPAVGDNDLWIAATAILLDATLVTRDRDFDVIDNLRRVDWPVTSP